jgi:hypothetical protein
MSKIPPQRTKALYNTFNLFGSCHKLINFVVTKIGNFCLFRLILAFWSVNNNLLGYGNKFSK